MSESIYRINCGAISQGIDGWLDDQEWTDGADYGYIGGGNVTREPDLPIHADELKEVIRSEHFNAEGYKLKLEAGTYCIRIISAVTFEGQIPVQKSFSVGLNGDQLIKEFEPYKISGGLGRPAIIEVDGYKHEGGELSIDLGEQSLMNGIEISTSSASAEAVTIQAPAKDYKPPMPSIRTKMAKHFKILFIGNSGTFFWAIPETLRSMLNNSSANISISFEKSLSGGKRFEWHYNESDVLEKIAENKYDIVAMQDSSGGPLDFTDSMKEYGGKLIEAVRAAGSQALLYAYQGPERYTSEQRHQVMQYYLDIAKEHDVRVVPGAVALDNAMKALPNTNFHNPDRHHLGMFGGYVMACCFFEVLSGMNAENHEYPAVFGQEVLIPKDIARVLERCAHEACVDYSNY